MSYETYHLPRQLLLMPMILPPALTSLPDGDTQMAMLIISRVSMTILWSPPKPLSIFDILIPCVSPLPPPISHLTLSMIAKIRWAISAIAVDRLETVGRADAAQEAVAERDCIILVDSFNFTWLASPWSFVVSECIQICGNNQ